VRVNACRGEPVDRPLSKRWILWSALGVVWGGTHVGLEALMGKGLFRLGVLLTLAWAVLLVLAVKRQRWAKHGAVLLGALGCYWIAVMHFRAQIEWLGVFPWIRNPENAGPAWVVPYNLLVDSGAVLGLAILWTSARVMDVGRDGWGSGFFLIVSGVLAACGMASVVVRTGVSFLVDDRKDWVYDHLAAVVGIAVVSLIVMMAATARAHPSGLAPGR
jgi:hypothetical protein